MCLSVIFSVAMTVLAGYYGFYACGVDGVDLVNVIDNKRLTSFITKTSLNKSFINEKFILTAFFMLKRKFFIKFLFINVGCPNIKKIKVSKLVGQRYPLLTYTHIYR